MFRDFSHGYLIIDNLRHYLIDVVASHLINRKGGVLTAVSKSYLDTLKRSFNALVYAFVWPKVTAEEWAWYWKDLADLKTHAGQKAAEIAPRISKSNQI